MKIIITSHGEDCQSPVDSRFGRADYFLLHDEEAGAWATLENVQQLEAAHGAGIQAAQQIAKTGATALITGHVGPKAFKVLQSEGIKMYSVGENVFTAQEALQAFQGGQLQGLETANGQGMKK